MNLKIFKDNYTWDEFNNIIIYNDHLLKRVKITPSLRRSIVKLLTIYPMSNKKYKVFFNNYFTYNFYIVFFTFTKHREYQRSITDIQNN